MPRPDYNHAVWPSPRARLVAIKLELDIVSRSPLTRMKRLTHLQALELLRKRARKATVEDFLAMPKEQAWIELGSYIKNGWSFNKIPVDPLYSNRW